MIRVLPILFALTAAAMAEKIGDGYWAASNAKGGDRVIKFGPSKPREYFERVFLAEAPQTKDLVKDASLIKFTWKLLGYFEGRAIYDLVHSVNAYGGEWGVKTILVESSGGGSFRPVFCRETQPRQWPITETLFSFADGSLGLIDRYQENARISEPRGHVILAKKGGWIVEDSSMHPQLFKSQVADQAPPPDADKR